jgi:hypothetical protein
MDYVVVTKVAQGMYGFWCAPTKTQDSYENQICFSSHFVPKDFEIQTRNCLMLWKATSIGPCAKSTSLGYNSNCVDTLGHVVLNQSRGYWLLSDALAAAISLICQM